MKKIVMTMGAFFALSIATAQGGYVSLSAGYAGGGNTVIGRDYVEITEGKFDENFNWISGTDKRTNIIGSNGAGIPISLAGGYMISENFGVELGFTYLMGSELTLGTSTKVSGYKNTTTSKGSQIRILPQLVISTGSAMPVEIYAKTGLLVPVSGSTTINSETLDAAGFKSSVEYSTKGAFSLGYTGTLGVAYGITDQLSVFGEMQGVNLGIKGASVTMTKNTYKDEDKLSDLKVNQKETVFVDELTSEMNTKDSEPSSSLATISNYSSIGFNFGVKFNF